MVDDGMGEDDRKPGMIRASEVQGLLIKYGGHLIVCRKLRCDVTEPCDCGYSAVIDRLTRGALNPSEDF